MRYSQYLNEEHVTYVNIRAKLGMDLYVNPTSDELRELYKQGIKQVRFIADPDSSQLFVFDALPVLHDVMIAYLMKNDYIKNNKVFCGVCDIVGGKLRGVGTAYANTGGSYKLINNIEWFKKYIPTDFTEAGFSNLIFER